MLLCVAVHVCIILDFYGLVNQNLFGYYNTAIEALIQICHALDIELHDVALAGDQCVLHLIILHRAQSKQEPDIIYRFRRVTFDELSLFFDVEAVVIIP